MAKSARCNAQVKVWLMHAGLNPTTGDPAYVLPLTACVETLGLKRNQRFADLGPSLHFAKSNQGRAETAHPKHVICEIDDATAAATGWPAGFYRVRPSPRQVVERLGKATAPRKA